MPEYIDRGLLRRAMRGVWTDPDCPKDIADYIMHIVDLLPAEKVTNEPAVDPIRAAGGCYCRECVHWIGDIRAPYGNEKHGHCEVWVGSGCEMCMDADDFCSYGEPKKEVEE